MWQSTGIVARARGGPPPRGRGTSIARIAPVSLRSLFRQSALYTVGNITPKIGAFLLLPIYLRFLTQAEYGSLALLTSLAGILAVVYHLGLDGALMRLHFDVEGGARARLYTTATLFSIGLGALITILLSVVLGPYFERLFAGVPFVPLGALALLVALTGSLQYVPSTLFRASRQAGRFLAINLSSFAVSSITSVTLVAVFDLGPTGVLTGQLVGSTAVFLVTLVVIRRLGPWAFDAHRLREALSLGLPLLPHGIAGWALRLGDRWLIALLIGLPAVDARSQLGVYAVGYQLGFVVTILVSSFNAAWSPFFFEVGNRPSGPRFHTQMTTLVIGSLLILAAAISVLAPEIVALIARPGYEAAADVLPIIAFASVLHALYTMFVAVVFLAKRTARLATITLAAAAVNVAVNVALIPLLGIFGAAWATLASYVFFAAATYIYARGMYPVSIDWARIGLMSAFAITGVAAGRWLAPGPSLASGAVHIGITLAVAVAIAAVTWHPLQGLRTTSRALPGEA